MVRLIRTARFSMDLQYRYDLGRWWAPDLLHPEMAGEVVIWIMLNPSTATDVEDDPTIRRCISFAHRWGYGGTVVLNLFGLRSADPAALLDSDDPVGLENDQWIRHWVGTQGGLVMAAWGAHRAIGERAQEVSAIAAERGRDLLCLGTTASGAPRHPLYVPGATEPQLWQRNQA